MFFIVTGEGASRNFAVQSFLMKKTTSWFAATLPALALAFSGISQQVLAADSTFPAGNKLPTCKVAPAGLDSFRIEHPVDVTSIMSGLTPALPDAISAAVFVEGKEVRSRITYDKTTRILQNDLFLVEPGAPLPSSDDTDFASERFAFITVKTQKVYLSCKPYATVMVTGTTTDGYPIYAPPAGAPYSFAFAYKPGTSGDNTVREVVSLSSGIALLYTKEAIGKVSFVPRRKP